LIQRRSANCSRFSFPRRCPRLRGTRVLFVRGSRGRRFLRAYIFSGVEQPLVREGWPRNEPRGYQRQLCRFDLATKGRLVYWRLKMPIQILLADDHQLVRQGLKLLLEREGFKVTGEAENGHEAVKLAQELHPDVALIDLAMPLFEWPGRAT